MYLRIPHHSRQGVLLLALFVLLLLALCQSGLGAAVHSEDASEGRDAFCSVRFAESYFASIATTMPIAGRTPLAQTGHLYVDEAAAAVRIDQFFRNHRTTLLLDNRRLRGFLFFGERDFQATASAASATTEEDDAGSDANRGDTDDMPQQRCHVFYLPRKVKPFCVPQGYAVDSHPTVVRGVPATVFKGMEGHTDMPLVEQSFYVVNSSTTLDAATPLLSFLPWRLEYRARPDLESPKIAGAPYTLPNWRFFGHPMFDELALSSAETAQLQAWQPVVDLMTVDFYDYFPTEHLEGTFAVPSQCTAVLRRDAAGGESGSASRRGRGDAQTSSEEEEETAAVLPRLQLATLHRFMLQWHRLQNASTTHLESEGVMRTMPVH